MGVVGTLLKNRRAGEVKLAWNLPNLSAPETLVLTSDAFADGEAIPADTRSSCSPWPPLLLPMTGRLRSRRGPGRCCRRSLALFSRGAGLPA
jgi:hypothetical protein